MIQRIAGAGFLLSAGVVLIGLIWGLGDDVAIYQNPDGYCELATGEVLGRLEDRRAAADTDGDGRLEYVYLRLGRYDVANELPSGSLVASPPYSACRLIVPPEDSTAADQEFFADIDADMNSKPAVTVVAIYDNAANPSYQCMTEPNSGIAETAESATPCNPDPTVDDRTMTYADYGVTAALLVDTPVPNVRIENASWNDQPEMFDQSTPQGRLINQSVVLYGILAFAGVGGAGLSYFFRRRRQQ